jgi:hypothetical protein
MPSLRAISCSSVALQVLYRHQPHLQLYHTYVSVCCSATKLPVVSHHTASRLLLRGVTLRVSYGWEMAVMSLVPV